MNYYLVMAKVTPRYTANEKMKFEAIGVHVMYLSAQRLNRKLANDEVVAHIQHALSNQGSHKESYVYGVTLTEFKKIPVDTIVIH